MRLLLTFFAVVLALAAHARTTAPDWMREAARLAPAAAAAEVDATILLDEQRLTVEANGTYRIRVRKVTKILTDNGRTQARALFAYEQGAEKIRSLDAWLIRPDGATTKLDKSCFADVAVYASALELYSERRARLGLPAENADPGSIFGYEADVEQTAVLGQLTWSFQRALPVERSVFAVSLPDGWTLDARVFNHAPVEPRNAGGTAVWELRHLPAFENVPFGNSFAAGAVQLALDLKPPLRPGRPEVRATFSDWRAVSAYFTPAFDAAAVPDPAITQRVAQAVAVAPTPWDQVTALCRLAQSANYISIDLDAAHAGGFRPRPAPAVFRCNYGDCKDKSTLLRALLAAHGVESWPVAVFALDRDRVKPDWPSPLQFNHCILAIRIGDNAQPPALLVHPTLGRLMLFDPTDPYTPPGLLPTGDQGGFGLLLAGESGGLITLPTLDAAHHHLDRQIRARIAPDGSISGTIEEHFAGSESSAVRAGWRAQSATDFQARLATWLATTLNGPQITRCEPRDDFVQGNFDLGVDFNATRFARRMRNTLLIFKPVVVARRSAVILKPEPRLSPIALPATRFTERTELALPAGYRLDEMPPPLELRTSFGTYTSHGAIADGKFIFSRRLELQATTLPATEYEHVRRFFEQVAETENTPVVLERVEPTESPAVDPADS
ncbi:DUF3857 domain-containing protein [Horticoccus luteus]|uniref:DUF3857 domain-containing protein n=1 Tax=Horticoccus luteus TaxID=2862869 RepID=A0A8F9XJJ6_9BACT|nr:DUF3857 domain-containing protein [Horticoccus luteus]QYM78728.1 DUF3857 domain-containing protein [Horticoccus luteus]